jgi:hypothetical protein
MLCEPRRVIELTTCAGLDAVLPVPEDIVREENMLVPPSSVKATLTKIVISNIRRDNTIV